jgi:histidinol dehydrogenase
MTKGASAKGVLNVLESDKAAFARAFQALCRRRVESDDTVERTVRKILERVRELGDEEVVAHTRKLDGARVDALEVTRDEWDAGC